MPDIRIDKWLWAARFYKIRSLASHAVKAGHIDINGERCKPSKIVKISDVIRIRKENLIWEIMVTALADKRGSATVAATLYAETVAGIRNRLQQLEQQQSQSLTSPSPNKRPDKQQRRQIHQFKQRQQ